MHLDWAGTSSRIIILLERGVNMNFISIAEIGLLPPVTYTEYTASQLGGRLQEARAWAGVP